MTGLLVVVIVAGAIPLAVDATHCVQTTSTSSSSSSGCGSEGEYDSNENHNCSTQEELTDGDMDGDGTDDCDDPDDDGDHLSDKLEREHEMYDYRDKDSDDDIDDTPDDGYDLVPRTTGGAAATITATGYDAVGNDCCGDATLADPYIPNDELVVTYGVSDISLPSPSGWRLDDPTTPEGEDGHVEERQEDAVSDLTLDDGDSQTGDGDVTGNTMDLPDDIRDYPGKYEGGLPRVTLTIGLKDHDVAEDDRMDLTDGSAYKAVLWETLTNDDDTSVQSSSGAGDGLNSGVEFQFADTPLSTPVHAAVYHRDNPGDPVVQTTDI